MKFTPPFRPVFWIALLAALAAPLSAQTRYQVGDIVQDFELIDRSTGQPVKLSDFEGQVVFLEWFANWCPFCQAAAREIGPGIVDYYAQRSGNLNGVPVKHISINLQEGQETETQQFIDFYRLGQVLNDFNRDVASRFQSGGQPIFAIINGVAGSPSHAQWELMYSQLGYGNISFPIETFRQVIDSVQASTAPPDPEPEPEPEPEPPPPPDPDTGIDVPTATPTIVRAPVAQTVRAGDRAELIVAANGGGLSYQWTRNGSLIAGADSARLVIERATPADAGNYLVSVTNDIGVVSTEAVALSLNESVEGRLVNLSSRAFSGTGLEQLVPSFVANGPMTLLVRAVGPTLADFGVMGALNDPRFELTAGSDVVAGNDNWGMDSAGAVSALREAAGQVGAFALREGGGDAALLYSYDGGPRTAPVSDVAGGSGSALVEVYAVPDSSRNGTLANLAARGLVPAGEPLVAGFVLGGDRARTLLIRGVGPELANFGVSTALVDPVISIASGGTEFVSNDDWSTDVAAGAQIASIASMAGAFSLSMGSADAALLITLSPGAYTVQVTGKDGASGIVLAEIYDVTGL